MDMRLSNQNNFPRVQNPFGDALAYDILFRGPENRVFPVILVPNLEIGNKDNRLNRKS